MGKHALHKRIKKAILTNPITLWIVSRLVANFIRLVYYTSKRKYTIHPDAAPYYSGERNMVYAFWHGRLMMMPPMAPPKRKMNVMISAHNDGMLIAHAMHAFGFGIVEGSSRRGGMQAARAAIEVVKRGENVSITPDGPKGPAMTLQPGVIAISRLTKTPIVPVTFSASRHIRLGSWDRFMVALPFGTLYYHVGAPMQFDRNTDEQTAMEICERNKRALTAAADAEAGVL